jgi:putative transposase
MPSARHFLFQDSQAGGFNVVSRLAGRAYYLEEDNGREEFVKMMRAYEDVCGVEVLTYCVMSNHFHLLVRVPHRPEGFDVPLEVVVARLERALGETAGGELRKQLEFWRTTKN